MKLIQKTKNRYENILITEIKTQNAHLEKKKKRTGELDLQNYNKIKKNCEMVTFVKPKSISENGYQDLRRLPNYSPPM